MQQRAANSRARRNKIPAVGDKKKKLGCTRIFGRGFKPLLLRGVTGCSPIGLTRPTGRKHDPRCCPPSLRLRRRRVPGRALKQGLAVHDGGEVQGNSLFALT